MIPDLSLWRHAAAIVSLLLLALIGVGFAVGAPPSQAFYAFNAQRLQEFQAAHEPRTRTPCAW